MRRTAAPAAVVAAMGGDGEMSWFRRVIRPGRFAQSLVMGVIAFSLGASGIALALAGIPGADNLFHGCVGASGLFRVIPDTETCRSSEFPLLIPSKAYVDGAAGGNVAAEAAARQAADTTLQTNINNEAAVRQAADASLQNNINAEAAAARLYTDNAVQNEATARQAADNALQNNINAASAVINNEIAARQAADTTLQMSINNEAAVREAADNQLQNNINAEAAARQAGDVNGLQAANAYTDTSVQNEAAARQAADTQLQLNIDAEAAARAAADASLQSQISSLSPAYQIVAATELNAAPLATNDVLEVLVSCPAGKVVLGGGASLETQGLALRETIPVGTTQWRARGMATKPINASSVFITAYAICARP